MVDNKYTEKPIIRKCTEKVPNKIDPLTVYGKISKRKIAVGYFVCPKMYVRFINYTLNSTKLQDTSCLHLELMLEKFWEFIDKMVVF